MNPSPAVLAQMFLMFRVLLMRISSQHLTSLWPIMVTELVKFCPSFIHFILGVVQTNGPVDLFITYKMSMSY